MQNNDDKTNEKQTEASQRKPSEIKSLFSEKEIRTIVKNFVTAYLGGQVKINFPEANAILTYARQMGHQTNLADASKAELQQRMDFADKIAICVGTKKATPEELKIAIAEIFRGILAYRSGGRIIGVFMDAEMDARVSRLEEGMEKANNLLEEVINWIYRGVTEQ